MKKKIIEFKDFSFQYRVQAEPTVKNINLTIYEGEKVLIVGPSGSGKSTLSHCINGLAPFFYDGFVTGQLSINGNDATKMNIFEISKIVGTVLQDPDSQFIGLTVGEDIAFKLENYCVSQDEMIDKVNKSAELVDIKKELYTSPYKLSGGQKQRIASSRAIITNPKLILADEPTGALDSKSARQLLENFEYLNGKMYATILLVTHDAFSASYANRILFIKDGKIFNELTKGNSTRKEFFEKIIEVQTLLGGDLNNVL